MSKTALVTGASGFVGSHLAELLVAEGWKVRALLRVTSSTQWIDTDVVAPVFGEVTQPDSLGAAVAGVDTVFHVAGMTRAGDGAAYDSVNVEGTRNLVRAVREHAPRTRRFVLISSLAAAGPSSSDRPRLETDKDAPQNAYGLSKKRGEEALRKEAGQIPWTIIRPPAVYGPRDPGFLMLAKLAARGLTFRVTGTPQPISVIHVQDLVRGTLAAATTEETAGKTFYLSDREVPTFTSLGKMMAAGLGKKGSVLVVPRGLIPVVAGVTGVATGLVGKPNPLPSDRIRDLLAPAWTCNPSLAESVFGFRVETKLETGIRDTALWYRAASWI